MERYNFFLQTDDNLFQQEPFPEEAPNTVSIDDMHIRYERQTLRRLPRTQAIMFTVRTYMSPLILLGKEPQSLYSLRSAVNAWPEEMARYKGRNAWSEVFDNWCDIALGDFKPDEKL